MTKDKGGRPPFVPTERQRQRVLLAVSAGKTYDQIAQRLGIAKNTLRKHFENELDTGFDLMEEKVTGNLFQAALRGEKWAVIFLCKTRFGFVSTTNHQHGGMPDALPINVRDLTTEQILNALAASAAEPAHSERDSAGGDASEEGED